MADLDAGATGAMTGAGYPDGIRQIMDPFVAGDREAAAAAYQRWLPLINYENRQCGLIAAKVLMQEGGVIRSEMTRHPVLPLHPATRAGLIEIARRTRSAGAALVEMIEHSLRINRVSCVSDGRRRIDRVTAPS